MKKNCIIIFHVSTGDNLTVYPLVLTIYEKYENIYIFSLYRNKKFVEQLYKKYPKINIYILSEKYNNFRIPRKNIELLASSLGETDLIETGTTCNNWGNINIDNNLFWRKFYFQANLDYNIIYNYKTINRNKEIENTNYNNLISVYGDKYIFVHDHRNISYNHYSKRKNVIIESLLPIFHPNINYYNDENSNFIFCNKVFLWNTNFCYDNILDYCKIIENATEIHILDSSFSCLCPYLDLSKVKKKTIYTNYDIKDYNNSFKDWEIINY